MRTNLLLAAGLVFATPAWADDYVVVESVGRGADPRPAIERLARIHEAPVVSFDPKDLAPPTAKPRRRSSAYLALVMAPEHTELDFRRRSLHLATEIDAVPFAELAYGSATGAVGDVVVRSCRIGGPETRETLERYAADDRARHAAKARQLVTQLDWRIPGENRIRPGGPGRTPGPGSRACAGRPTS